MSIRHRFHSIVREYAPWWDKFDTVFAIALVIILLFGQFITQTGLITLITAFTVFIAHYRLRHHPNKTRPAVREDFDNGDGESPTDFGLRNFGPGPALYVQAAVEVVNNDTDEDESVFGPVPCLEVHESPIHLQEGEFASLALDRERSWFKKMIEESDIYGSEGRGGCESVDSLVVNLHYTYISQSGAREPTDISTNRDDTGLLDNSDLTDRDDEPRQIKLSRVMDNVPAESLEQ